MIVAVSDTHATEAPELTGGLGHQLSRAEIVLHTGDFTTTAVLEAFETLSDEFVAVFGNNDEPAVRDRVDDVRTVDWAGVRFVLVHGHRHSSTSLPLLARQEGADIAVVGHSHRPAIVQHDSVTIVNPGSHAQPRGYQAAYAVIEWAESDSDGSEAGVANAVDTGPATVEDDGDANRVSIELRSVQGATLDRRVVEGDG